MVDGRRAREADRRGRSGRPRAAPGMHLPRRAQHEPRRLAPRPSQDQRRRREPQPRMARASAEKSPEVLCVRNAMDETGVDFAMDVHGDEAIPANFLAGFEGIPSLTDAPAASCSTLSARRSSGSRPISSASRATRSPRRQGQHVDVHQPARRALRLRVDDAGNAVQGQLSDAISKVVADLVVPDAVLAKESSSISRVSQQRRVGVLQQ